MKNIIGIVIFSTALLFMSFNHTGVKDYTIRKVVIDAGHGGKDPGTSGQFSREKDIALSIALETGATIKEYMPDVEVIYTRNDDSFPTLRNRSEIANNNHADLFISIHCNSAPWSNQVHGTETYVMGLQNSGRNFEVAKRENSVILLEENYEENYQGFDPNSPESYILFSLTQNAFQERSISLASKVEEQFKNRVGRKSRGVKQSSLYVLWSTAMPSVLIETGYLSNAKEERDLNDKLQQTYIASGIFRAFRDYKNELESNN
ncbi:N-acetylmuramoyl-L-alanine amidase family protein [Reichenbachiella versicolor]|uniref:N-acetylmuramoyl-L-alanine amidase family protein n=1 Tax=Reichenbachiella versicolor TaxID=1821036 RepID=UPI000D6E2DA3|nr:N-acetylmuramoyl-L-alanine amidase [Reichenbachiella versicolor]